MNQKFIIIFFCFVTFTTALPVQQQSQLQTNNADVNKRMQMVNTQTCSYDPQTLQATCNVKELLEAHRASSGTALAMNPTMKRAAEISASGQRCRVVIIIIITSESLACVIIIDARRLQVEPGSAVLASDPIHNAIAQQKDIDYGKLPRCQLLPNGELKCPGPF